MGTPVGLQPTELIRSTWINKKIGAVGEVSVMAVHDGRTLAFRLAWADATQNQELGDTTAFPDGAAILLPSKPGAPSVTMGAPGLAVNAWYWRADENGHGREVVAEGLGTTRMVSLESVKGQGSYGDGGWQVVITRSLAEQVEEPVAQLSAGSKTGFAVAIWEGGAGERAGIKAFSGDWQELVLEGVPTAAARG